MHTMHIITYLEICGILHISEIPLFTCLSTSQNKHRLDTSMCCDVWLPDITSCSSFVWTPHKCPLPQCRALVAGSLLGLATTMTLRREYIADWDYLSYSHTLLVTEQCMGACVRVYSNINFCVVLKLVPVYTCVIVKATPFSRFMLLLSGSCQSK